MDFHGTAGRFGDILTAGRFGSEPLGARPVLCVSQRPLRASGAHLGAVLAPPPPPGARGAETNAILVFMGRGARGQLSAAVGPASGVPAASVSGALGIGLPFEFLPETGVFPIPRCLTWEALAARTSGFLLSQRPRACTRQQRASVRDRLRDGARAVDLTGEASVFPEPAS